jgi:hypothetical protein
MKHQAKLNSEQQQQQAAEQQTQSQPALEFATTEELLRYDAAHTPVPDGIAQRLQKSAGGLPLPSRPWWKRFFGGSK